MLGLSVWRKRQLQEFVSLSAFQFADNLRLTLSDKVQLKDGEEVKKREQNIYPLL